MWDYDLKISRLYKNSVHKQSENNDRKLPFYKFRLTHPYSFNSNY